MDIWAVKLNIHTGQWAPTVMTLTTLQCYITFCIITIFIITLECNQL